MPEKLAVLVQNELNLNLNEIFSDAVERGIQIRHLPLYHTQDEKKSFAQHVTATMLLPVGNHGI